MTLKELAKKINLHLWRLERDPKANPPDHWGQRFFMPNAQPGTKYITIRFRGASGLPYRLTRPEAERYLAALDSGFTGRSHDLVEMEAWEKEHPRG